MTKDMTKPETKGSVVRAGSTPSSRRGFLRQAAFGLALSPLLGGALGNAALGAEPASTAPGRARRFVGVYAPHGMAREFWRPGPGFDLRYENCSLQPFDDPATVGQSLRDRVVVIEGIDLSAGIEAGTVGHEGARVILTGSAADGDNASIDQFLAVEQGLGFATPYSSLVLAVGTNGTDIGTNISYLADGRPVPKLVDPSVVFDSVFGELILPADPTAAAKVRAQRALKKSSLDFLGGQLGVLAAHLPPSEARRLDQHLTAQRELERRLAHFEVACRVPERPPAFERVTTGNGGARYFDAITDLQIDLMVQAMACDATRFGTIFLTDLSRTRLIDGMPEDIHFDVSHRYRARDAEQPGRPDTWLPLAKQNRYAYSKVARLMHQLDAAGLLGDTVIYVSSDMGDPARHSSRSVPTLLGGGVFRGGRHLVVEGKAQAANNHLLVSICNAFGVGVTSFGQARDPAIVTGPLAGL